MSNEQTLSNNQQGMVSIVVTMIIMVVLTLIVTGFAQLARREQREALDRQLSTQALYAAESGVNDVIKQIKSGATVVDNDACSPGATSNINGTDVQYTCLLVSSKNKTQKYQNVQIDTSTIASIELATGTLKKLNIDWENKADRHDLSDASQLAATSTPLVPVDEWGATSVGILRVDLVPIDSLNVDSLKANTLTAFFYPKETGGTGSINYPAAIANKGSIVTSKCGDASYYKKCRVTVTGLEAHTKYIIRIKSIYTVSDVEVCANDCGSETLTGQYQIDSTGRANDVLKRISVRYPKFNPSNTVFPEYVLDSADDVCKLMSVWPGPGGTDDGCPSSP